MPSKKKKKPATNPARGFATVSVPSRLKDTTTIPDASAENDEHFQDAKEEARPEDPLVSDNKSKAETNIPDMSPDELEAHFDEAELRAIVDDNAARVKNDASRQVSRLRNERRQLRLQADSASVKAMTGQLVEGILYAHPTLDWPSNYRGRVSVGKAQFDETNFLLKLWTLYEVLVELKMPSVDDALAHVLSVWFRNQPNEAVDHVTGLFEAFEWYAKNKGPNELPNYDTGEVAITAEQGELDEEENSEPATTTEHVVEKHEETTDDLSVHETLSEFDLSDSDDDDDPDSLVERWVRLQTLNFTLEEHKNASAYDSRKRKNDQRLQAIERDVLFDAYQAQQKWQLIHRDLDIERARANKHKKKAIQEAQAVPVNAGIELHYEDDAILGSMFGNDESNSTEPAAEASITVIVKDFGTWTGIHPRRLMEEICSGNMARQGVKYTPLQVTSFSARMKLAIYWQSKTVVNELVASCLPYGVHFVQKSKSWALEMRAIATINSSDAEAFLATLTIFLLDAADLTTTKSLLRLPKVWRDLCADLKKSLEGAQSKEDVVKLKGLRSLIQAKSSNGIVVSTQSVHDGEILVSDSELPARKKKAPTRLHAAEATEMWLRRAKSTAFEKMQVARRDLPVFAYKQDILDSFEENQILLICADTGAGKSTQIPSYILENGLRQGRDLQILVTQPRRISAVSIAGRVSAELGEGKNDLGTPRSLVGYTIRLETKTSPSTRITFATTGVLLRMLQDSPNLDPLDCLILDEVHERTMELDLLFIALKQLRARRPSLKIVLMSATVDASKFSNYFDNCPVLNIPGRTFPVEIGFLEDAIEETLDINCAVEGPQDEEDRLGVSDSDEVETKSQIQSSLKKYSVSTQRILNHYDYMRIDYQLILKLATAIATKPKYRQYSKAMLIFMPGIAEIRRLHSMIVCSPTFSSSWIIHMLHSSFSTQELEQAFLPPPPGFQKIVIATNIAETGITIPDVTVVIDTCKEKVMRFDERRQLSKLTEGLISRSSARQRRGRAARVRAGLCFHLVTRHHHDTRMPEQATPEMLRLSLQDPILRIKIWNLGSIENVLSSAIDPPTAKNIRRAISKLRDVGAIDSAERLTPLGRLLAKLPLDVALSKMAIYGVLFQSLDAVLTIIATFSVKSIFIEVTGAKSLPQSSFTRGDSDLIAAYDAYSGWKKACKAGTGQQYCHRYHLSQFQLLQVEEQKVQLLAYLIDAGLVVLDQDEQAALNRARTSRQRTPEFEIPLRYDRLNSDAIIAAITAVAFYPKLLRRESGKGYKNVYTNQQIQLAPTSPNKVAGSKPPKWLCYFEAMQARNGSLKAFNLSQVTEPMILVLLGDAEFRFFAGVVVIDNGSVRLKLRYWKEMFALQHLRQQVRRVVETFLVHPESPLHPNDIRWLDLMATILNDGQPQSQGGILK